MVSSSSRRPCWSCTLPHLKHLLLKSPVPSSGTVFRNTVAASHESTSFRSLRSLSTSAQSDTLRVVNCSVAVCPNCGKQWAGQCLLFIHGVQPRRLQSSGRETPSAPDGIPVHVRHHKVPSVTSTLHMHCSQFSYLILALHT